MTLSGTRSLWLPPGRFAGDGTPAVQSVLYSELNGYLYVPFNGAADFHDYADLLIPRDFGGFTGCSIFLANGNGTSAANTRWRIGVQHVLEGGQADDPMSYSDTTIAPYGIPHQIKEAAITLPALTWAKADAIRLMLARLATDGADTNPDEMRLLGMRLDYAWAP